jgi:hypothetical protein
MRRTLAIIVGIFIMAQVLDVITTLVGYGYGLSELNPIGRNVGFPVFVIIKLGAAFSIPIILSGLLPPLRYRIPLMEWAAFLSTVGPVHNSIVLARIMWFA